jgi:hypothetical protein
MLTRRYFAAACLLAAAPARAVPVFGVQGVALCQSNLVLLQRLGTPAALSAYVLKIEGNMNAVFAAAGAQAGASAAMVVAVKPGPQSRVWLIDPTGTLSGLAPALAAAASAVTPPAIRQGPIAFAILFQAWGGSGALPAAFPIPAAWAGATVPEVIPDGPLARVWP